MSRRPLGELHRRQFYQRLNDIRRNNGNNFDEEENPHGQPVDDGPILLNRPASPNYE